jgi:hypothetical protein
MRKLVGIGTLFVAALCLLGAQNYPYVPPAPVGVAGPTLIETNAVASTASTPVTLSAGTVNVNDIVDYFVWAQGGATLAFTPSLTGSCASTGGNVTDMANSGFAGTSFQKGHFVITTGGACTVSIAYTGGSAFAALAHAVIRNVTTALADASFNTQSVSTGTNNVSSVSLTTTVASLCVADTVDTQTNAGVLTAGTNIAWVIGTIGTAWPVGNETFLQSSAGAIIADFSYAHAGFPVTGKTCYH